VIFLILLFSLFFPKTIFATPQVSIIDYPSTVFIGQTFPLTFNISDASIGTTFHYKTVGDTTTDISIFPSCVSKYDDCLSLTISNSSHNIATATAQINNQSNSNNLKIRIAQSGQHSKTYDSPYINIISLLLASTPTPINSPEPTIAELTPTIFNNPLILSEIMANPNTDQNEWIEIYNPSSQSISLSGLCFFDASSHSRCFSDDESINPNSYYTHSFSSGFLNNDGDTVTFLNTSIIYPKSSKNLTYSRQTNDSWCFTNSSQDIKNNDCSSVNILNSSETNYVSPLLTLQSVPSSVNAGDDFNLVFSLNSADPYSLRLISPFGSQYFPFNNFKDGYSWLTLPLSVPKKLPEGIYPLSFHLKKATSNHLFDYQLGEININAAIVTPKISKSKVLGVSTYSYPLCPDNSSSVNYYPASTLSRVLPDANFFSWPFLFAGSILFLSPILFPKLYSV
jgi:hypothetical protein